MPQPVERAGTAPSDSTGRTNSWRDLVPPIGLCILILAYVVSFSILSIRKHDTYHSYTYDLGIMIQVTWNTAYGRLFQVSLDRPLDTELVGSYLGNHVRPILLLVAPFYRLWSSPWLLLILQSVALGLGALPLWWIARKKLDDPRLRIAVVASYLFYPALGYLNLYDFHPVALSIPLLLLAYWALLEKRDLVFWTAIVLSLATKEELVVPVAAFGIYCLFHSQYRKRGIALLGLAAMWAFLCFVVIIPYYNQGQPYRFFELWSHLTPVPQANLGGGSGKLSSNIALERAGKGIAFVLHLFFPLGFLPLLNPGLLAVSLPSLAYLLLSSRPALYSIGYQYPAVLIPWLYLATVYGLAWLERQSAQGARVRLKRVAFSLWIAGAIAVGLVFSPIVIHWLNGAFSRESHHADVEAALAQIPPRASVAATGNLGPHLAHRRTLLDLEHYPLPVPQDHLQQIDYVLADVVESRAVATQIVHDVLASGEFGVDYWSGRILLLRRGAPVTPEIEQVRAYVNRSLAEE